jgi:hypothetical protein
MWTTARDLSGRVFALEFGARVALSNGHPNDAARLLGAVQVVRDRGEPFLAPGSVIGLPDIEPQVRSALPAAEFQEAFEEGRGWPEEKALEIAAALDIGP